MMTVVCQGLESRLESQLMESRTLKLKLFSTRTEFSPSLETALQSCIVPADYFRKLDSPPHPKLHGGSSLQNLPSTTLETSCEKLKTPYVHPSAKHASFWLSEKSLNLCTENLGSETGSEFIENRIFSSPACSTNENNKIRVERESRPPRHRLVLEPKKQIPPPLTILSGPECINLRPQREDGRLILKATRTTPARRSCFQVNRSNGRLRLYLADSRTSMCSSDEEDKEVTSDQKVIYNGEGEYENEKLEKNIPNKPAYSSYEEAETSSLMEVEHVETKKLFELDQQRRGASSCCRCNESHKNNNKNVSKKKGLMTSMVKLESRFLVASS